LAAGLIIIRRMLPVQKIPILRSATKLNQEGKPGFAVGRMAPEPEIADVNTFALSRNRKGDLAYGSVGSVHHLAVHQQLTFRNSSYIK